VTLLIHSLFARDFNTKHQLNKRKQMKVVKVSYYSQFMIPSPPYPGFHVKNHLLRVPYSEFNANNMRTKEADII